MGIEGGVTAGTNSSSKDVKFTQADWLAYMPRAVVDIIEGFRCLDSWPSKVRLVESIIFASLVVYGVSVAAWPAFHPIE
jgi:hypothetical protein